MEDKKPHGNLGHFVSKETREKLRLAKLGKPNTPESKEKNRIASLGNKYRLGKPWSEKDKQRLSKIHKGRKLTLEHRNKIHLSHMKPETLLKKRELRSKQTFPIKDTKIEIKVQELLNSLSIKYVKHYIIKGEKIGFHPVDMMILDHDNKPKIAIECDGCYWHGCPEHHPETNFNKERDRLIDECLKDQNIKIIRFWEHEIEADDIIKEVTKIQEVIING